MGQDDEAEQCVQDQLFAHDWTEVLIACSSPSDAAAMQEGNYEEFSCGCSLPFFQAIDTAAVSCGQGIENNPCSVVDALTASCGQTGEMDGDGFYARCGGPTALV